MKAEAENSNTNSESALLTHHERPNRNQRAIRSKSKTDSQVEIDLTKTIKEMGNIEKIEQKDNLKDKYPLKHKVCLSGIYNIFKGR
jgi:hypothetical protein